MHKVRRIVLYAIMYSIVLVIIIFCSHLFICFCVHKKRVLQLSTSKKTIKTIGNKDDTTLTLHKLTLSS